MKPLFKTSLFSPVLAFALGFVAIQAHADDTLAKIKSSGRVTMGVRESSGVLSYLVGATGEYVGYQVDICKHILLETQKKLGLNTLDIKYLGVTAQNRIPLLVNGTIDLECGSTAITQARQRDVAFSYATYVEETRVLVKLASGIDSIDKLAGKRVVSTAGTTSLQTLRRNPRVNGLGMSQSFAKDHSDSFLLLESGRADAFVMDRQVLATLVAGSRDPSSYRILSESLSIEPVAIVIRKDEPAFKKIVDDTIAAMFANGEMAKLYDKWFKQPVPPANIRLNLDPSPATLAAWSKPTEQSTEEYAARK